MAMLTRDPLILFPGCSKLWDNLTCWPATPRGQVVVFPCPLIFKIFSSIEGKSLGLRTQGAGEPEGTGRAWQERGLYPGKQGSGSEQKEVVNGVGAIQGSFLGE